VWPAWKRCFSRQIPGCATAPRHPCIPSSYRPAVAFVMPHTRRGSCVIILLSWGDSSYDAICITIRKYKHIYIYNPDRKFCHPPVFCKNNCCTLNKNHMSHGNNGPLVAIHKVRSLTTMLE
jgi:hypothetical protein